MGDFLAIDYFQEQIKFMFSKEESVKQFQLEVSMATCGLIKAKQANPKFLTSNKALKEHYELFYAFNNKHIEKSNDLNYA